MRSVWSHRYGERNVFVSFSTEIRGAAIAVSLEWTHRAVCTWSRRKPTISRALFDAAERWKRNNGVKKERFHLSTSGGHRLNMVRICTYMCRYVYLWNNLLSRRLAWTRSRNPLLLCVNVCRKTNKEVCWYLNEISWWSTVVYHSRTIFILLYQSEKNWLIFFSWVYVWK